MPAFVSPLAYLRSLRFHSLRITTNAFGSTIISTPVDIITFEIQVQITIIKDAPQLEMVKFLSRDFPSTLCGKQGGSAEMENYAA